MARPTLSKASFFVFPTILVAASLMVACAQDPSGSKKLNRSRQAKADRSQEMGALLGEAFPSYKKDAPENLEFVKKIEGSSAIVDATLVEEGNKDGVTGSVANVQIAFLVTGVEEQIEAVGSIAVGNKESRQLDVKGGEQGRFKVSARCKPKQIEIADEANQGKLKKATDPCASLIALVSELDPASQKVVGNAAMIFMHTKEALEEAKKSGALPTTMELLWISSSKSGDWQSGPKLSLENAKKKRAGEPVDETAADKAAAEKAAAEKAAADKAAADKAAADKAAADKAAADKAAADKAAADKAAADKAAANKAAADKAAADKAAANKAATAAQPAPAVATSSASSAIEEAKRAVADAEAKVAAAKTSAEREAALQERARALAALDAANAASGIAPKTTNGMRVGGGG